MNLHGAIDKSRYELLAKIASGGMGTVYVGRLRGAAGFSRLVAIKRAHPHLLEDANFSRMLIKEAELASAISHPNAVAVVDVESFEGELLLVMDYVHGVPLSQLIQAFDPQEQPLPPAVAIRIVLDACAGLQACHDACDEDGQPLRLVHRDVSPQNVLVGVDGQGRLTDFGIAKSQLRDDKLTATGSVRGKTGYMAPEYVAEGKLDHRSDVFAAGVVLWEAIAGKRLFRGATDLETLKNLTETDAPLLSEAAPWVGDTFDDVVATALCREPEGRFSSADAFGNALEKVARSGDLVARHRVVGELVHELFGDELSERRARLVHDEAQTHTVTAALGDTRPEPSTLEASNLATRPESPTKQGAGQRVIGGVLAVAVLTLAVVVISGDDEATPVAAPPAAEVPVVASAAPSTVARSQPSTSIPLDATLSSRPVETLAAPSASSAAPATAVVPPRPPVPSLPRSTAAPKDPPAPVQPWSPPTRRKAADDPYK